MRCVTLIAPRTPYETPFFDVELLDESPGGAPTVAEDILLILISRAEEVGGSATPDRGDGEADEGAREAAR